MFIRIFAILALAWMVLHGFFMEDKADLISAPSINGPSEPPQINAPSYPPPTN